MLTRHRACCHGAHTHCLLIAQVHLWREWKRLDEKSISHSAGAQIEGAAEKGHTIEQVLEGDGPRDGKPLERSNIVPLSDDDPDAAALLAKLSGVSLMPTPARMAHLPRFSSERVGLIVPTSLCSSQVCGQLATRLNAAGAAEAGNLSRIVALPHTEGCGNSNGESEEMFVRTILGYDDHNTHRLLTVNSARV